MGERFIINGTVYCVEPDVKRKTHIGYGMYAQRQQGFAGRKFTIKSGDRKIITHNLWEEGPSTEPDNAEFVGKAPQKVRIRRTKWEEEHLPR